MSNDEVHVQQPAAAGDAHHVIIKQETMQTRRVSLPSSSVAGAVAEEETPPAKRIKLETGAEQPGGPPMPASPPASQQQQPPTPAEAKSLVSPEQTTAAADPAVVAEVVPTVQQPSQPSSTATDAVVAPASVSGVVPATTSAVAPTASAGATPSTSPPPPADAADTAPPLKAVTMLHLKTKYSGELEYMLREFRKLERQLLGAKGATQMEESAGSRERREKLHSFILHLEDTIRQIELGCKLEAEGKSTVMIGVTTKETAAKDQQKKNDAPSNLTKEKEEEENVQKLEEHILANLLPVKVRLKKQLAAQQGATRNPAGMPATRRGMLQPSEAQTGKGTFAAAAELKRKQQAEASIMMAAQQLPPAEPIGADQTQFGKPLGQRGSSLTQKLHGQTLGSICRIHGHGVGKPEEDSAERKVVYAGVTVGSTQVVSGVAVASSVHKMVLPAPQFTEGLAGSGQAPTNGTTTTATTTRTTSSSSTPAATADDQHRHPGAPAIRAASSPKAPATTTKSSDETADAALDNVAKKKLEDPNLTEEERKLLKRKLKKKKLMRRAKRRDVERQRQVASQTVATHAGAPVKTGSGARKKGALGIKVNGKKTRGPRSVEYLCALCSEAYTSVCDYNPWWALAQHECPKCRKLQIPRIDISAPANAIEYHPALLAHIEDPNAGADKKDAAPTPAPSNAAESAAQATTTNPSPPPTKPPAVSSPQNVSAHLKLSGSDSTFASDLSDISDGNLSDISLDSEDSDEDVLMTPAEQAEHEKFGLEYTGPTLSDANSARLLILMLHASGCPCRHKHTKHTDVCQSTKYLMLHVRDCPGTTSNLDVCPFPWCRKVKHLLYHLVSCTKPRECVICSPPTLTKQMRDLTGLNEYRLKKQREHMIATMKAIAAARPPEQAPSPAPIPLAPTSALLRAAKASSVRPQHTAATAKNQTVPKPSKPLAAATAASSAQYQRPAPAVPTQVTSGPVVTVISGHTNSPQSASTGVAKKPITTSAMAPQPAAVDVPRPNGQAVAAASQPKPTAVSVVQGTVLPSAVAHPQPAVVPLPRVAVPDAAPSAELPATPRQFSTDPSQLGHRQSAITMVARAVLATSSAHPGAAAAPAVPATDQSQSAAVPTLNPAVPGATVVAPPSSRPNADIQVQTAAGAPSSTAPVGQPQVATQTAQPAVFTAAAAAPPMSQPQPAPTAMATPATTAPGLPAVTAFQAAAPAASNPRNTTSPQPAIPAQPTLTTGTSVVGAGAGAAVPNPVAAVVKHGGTVAVTSVSAATTATCLLVPTPAGLFTTSQPTEKETKDSASWPTPSEVKACVGSTDDAIPPADLTPQRSQGNATEAAGLPAGEAKVTSASEGKICIPTAAGNTDEAPHSEKAAKQVRVA